MLDECFAAADDRFLNEWIKFSSTAIIVEFMKRWLADERPWARQQMIRYLNLELNFAGHEVFIKRIFRHFEAAGDHEMMGHIMVFLDRLVRRSRVPFYTWNSQTRESLREERLFAQPNRTIVDQTGRTMEYGTGKWKRSIPLPDIRNKPTNRLFRHKTRNYLRRRVWRYFRWLSYRKPSEYIASMASALTCYPDEAFHAGENIIDNWSLMHACYFHSDVIRFTAAHTNLAPGQALGSLNASPYRSELWAMPESFEHLLRLLANAKSALVRVWAMELLQRDHLEANRRIEMSLLIPLMAHQDSRVQQFALEMFRDHQGLGTLTVSTWLELIEKSGPGLLSVICQSMAKHVISERLDNSQLIQLTTAQAVPVAEHGFEMLKTRHAKQPLTVVELVSLASAKCDALAGPITSVALQSLSRPESYSANTVVEFFDSHSMSMRLAAMDWLDSPESPGHNDAVLWAKLIETPFEDLRLRLVQTLHRRTTLPGTDVRSLTHIWSCVILGVHRGGRAKLQAIPQIQEAILRNPQQAETLLPVLAVAVRSLRAPERRAALAAVATLKVRVPELQTSIHKVLAGLEWQELVAN